MPHKILSSPTRSAGWLADILRQAGLIWSLWRDPRVPIGLKLIPPATLIYLLWPIDVLPDLFVGLGQLDDLAVVLLGLRTFIALVPDELVQQHRDKLAGRWHVNNPTYQSAATDTETVEGQYRVVHER